MMANVCSSLPRVAAGRVRPTAGRLALFALLALGLATGLWWSAAGASAQSGLPDAPDIHTITPLHQGLRVYWWPPARDGGSAVTGYDVHYRAMGAKAWTDAGHTGLSQPAVIMGLSFGTTYEVRVRARNANGAGSWSIVDSRRTARDDGRPDPPLPPTLTPGGSSLITGTSVTITGLDNGVLTGVVVAAVNSRGQSTWSAHTSEVAPIEALSLTLESSRDICTANTLTELSWTITGGVPPYTLTIEGKKVDSTEESHRINCGALRIDPQTEEPLPNQRKTFSALVSDSQADQANSRIAVKLAPPLPAPVDLRHGSHVDQVVISWRQVIDTGSSAALVRYRPIGGQTWRYALAQSHSIRAAHTLKATTDEHTAAVAAMRHPLEAETPTALLWSETVRYASVAPPQDLQVAATHDAVTVSWKKQPHAGGQMPFVTLASDSLGGFRAKRVFEEKGQHGRHEVVFRHVPPETMYTVGISMTDLGDSFTAATATISTLAAPPGWTSPSRGPQNLQASATHNSITVTWQAPHDDAYLVWSVQVIEEESGREINYQWFNTNMAWTIRSARNGDPLQAGRTYRLIVKHLTLKVAQAEVVVTTASAPVATQAAASALADERAKSTLLPFFPIWPVAIDDRYAMTDDPFEWRGARYHAGLDIGERGGASGIAAGTSGDVSGDPVYAVADGMLRLFSYERGHTVLYCHDDRLDLHERFHASSEGWGSAWWNGSQIYDGEKKANSDSFCDDVASFAGGKVALVAHTLPNGQGIVTKYGHLLGASPTVLAALVKDRSCLSSSAQPCEVDSEQAVRVARGQQIGTVGASFYGGSDNEFYDDHVHFEIRSFSVPLADNEEWYVTAERCKDVPGVTTGADCLWDDRVHRYMKSVEDAEAYLPPLPASFVPRDPGEGTGPIARNNSTRQVFEVARVDLLGTSSSATLDVTVSMALWRPAFYSQFGGQPSRVARGIAGTGPGVDRYHTNAPCALLPEDLLNDPIISNLPVLPDLPDLPTIDVRTGMAILSGDPNRRTPAGELPRESRVLRLNPDGPCKSSKVTVRASNAHWERQYPDQILDRADQKIELRDPSALITWSAELEASTAEETLPSQQLSGNAINFYTFVGHRGHTYRFCTIPPAPKSPVPGICANEGSASNTAELLLVGPGGPITSNVVRGTSGLAWTVPDSAAAEATYMLVVRRRDRERQANPSPANYQFALRFTVPPVSDCGSLSGISGQGGAVVGAVAATIVCRPPLPTDLTVTNPTASSLTLTWDGVDGATKYELKAIKTDDCEADQTPKDQFKSTTDTSYTFDLEANTAYTLCVRAVREIGSGTNKFEIISDWASEPGRTLAANQLPAPTNLRAVERTSGSLTLGWDESAGAQSYRVRLDEDDATVTAANDFRGSHTHRFTGLTSARAHKLQVQSVQGARTSEWSEPLSLYTLLPTPEIDANQVSTTSTTATFAWGEVTDADGYEVRRVPGDQTEKLGDVRSYQFDGLDPNTPYELSVRATLMGNSEVTSAWASTTKTTRPADPSLKTLALSGISFTFDPAVTSYRLTAAHDLSRTTVTATPTNANASLVIAPPDADTDTNAHDVQLNVGTTTITVTVSHAGATRVYTVSVTRPDRLTLTASADPTSCESGGTVVVSWTIGGGTTPYTVSVTGTADVTTSQATGSANYICPQAAGAASVSVSVQDAGGQRVSETLSLTVNASVPQLVIASATTTWTHCAAGQHQVPVDWSASGGKPPYTAVGTRIDADTVTLLCPAAGATTLTLVVTDSSNPPLTATAEVPITATQPLSLTARAESPSCEKGSQATVIWTVSGGAAPIRSRSATRRSRTRRASARLRTCAHR